MEEVKRAAGYIRVSTAEQAKKGLSIETQIAEIENYARQQGMKLEGLYIDRGITARKSLERRVDFMRMMHDVQTGKINHIIILRLDRFFRNVYDYHKMMNEYLTPNNCDWSAVKEQYSTSTTNGRFMINLRLAIAEQECDTDGDRITDVNVHRIAEGYVVSGGAPIGMMIKDKKMYLDPDKRHIAEDMFEYFETTNSVRGTMVYINNKYNLNLIYATVNRALRNPIYAGIRRNNKNFCERLISIERHEKILKMLKKNIKIKNAAQDYIFSGLIYCSHCGASMSGNCTTKPSKKVGELTYRYYRCPKKTRDQSCDNNLSIREEQIEAHLLENIEREIENHIVSVTRIQDKQLKVKSNRKQIEKKMERLNDLYINGFIDMDKYKADYKALEDQIIDEPEDKTKDLSMYKDFLDSDFKSIYVTLKDVEKRTFWRTIIQKIEVSGKEIKNIVFY